MNRLKAGDLVQVISGRNKGKQGKVTRVLAEDGKVVVEGVNVVTRHQKPNQRNQQGGKIQKEAPLAISAVMPVDPKTGKPTRVRIKTEADGKKKTRLAKSGAELGAS